MDGHDVLSIVTKRLRSQKKQLEPTPAKYERFESKQKLVAYLPSLGCQWANAHGGCTMCNFPSLGIHSLKDDTAIEYLRKAMSRFCTDENCRSHLKLFANGSFFNEDEVPSSLRRKILEMIARKKVTKLAIEVRPEHITQTVLRETLDIIPNTELELRVGVETSDDFIRKYCVHKGFLFEDFASLSKNLPQNVKLAAYLLLKPPFLTEKEAVDDAYSSVRDVSQYAERIILQPVSVQEGTLVGYLWRNGLYSPPSLWSLLEVGKMVEYTKQKIYFSGFHPIPRPLFEATTCPKCNDYVLDFLKKGKLAGIEKNCECYGEWKKRMGTSKERFETRISQNISKLAEEYGIQSSEVIVDAPNYGHEAVGFLKPDCQEYALFEKVIHSIRQIGEVEMRDSVLFDLNLLERVYPFSFGDEYIRQRNDSLLGKPIIPFRLSAHNAISKLLSVKHELRKEYSCGNSFLNLLHSPDSRGESLYMKALFFDQHPAAK
jgi:radical SAM enzyme (TIGR01210 family)